MTLRSDPKLRDAYEVVRADKKRERLERKAAAMAHIAARKASPAPGQKDPREKDERFKAWLRETSVCIACEIEGPPAEPGPLEAAHQKMAIAAAGWREGGLGPRTHDHRCVALCAWHHRLGRNSCDVGGQRKFWDRLGIGDGVADLCRALFNEFLAGGVAAEVIARFQPARTTPDPDSWTARRPEIQHRGFDSRKQQALRGVR